MARTPKDYEVDVQHVMTDGSTHVIRTGPSSALPSSLRAAVTLDDGQIWVFLAVQVLPHGNPRAVVRELAVATGDPERGLQPVPITTTLLRRILVDQILQAVLDEAMLEVPEPAEPEIAAEQPSEFDKRAAIAAKHYISARASGDRAPTQTVAQAMGVSRSQASRYIRAARDAGYLADVGEEASKPGPFLPEGDEGLRYTVTVLDDDGQERGRFEGTF